MFRGVLSSLKRTFTKDQSMNRPEVCQVGLGENISNTLPSFDNKSASTGVNVYHSDFETGGLVSFFALFRFATKADIAFLSVSFTAALLNGFCFPISLILFGKLSVAFVSFKLEENSSFSSVWLNNSRRFTTDTSFSVEPYIQHRSNDNSSITDDVVVFCVGTAAIHVISVLLSFIFITCLNIAAENQILRCRGECIKAILSQEIGWYDTQTTDGFTSTLSENLLKIQDGIGEKLGMLLTNLTIALICIGSAFYHGWELALVNAVALPVLAATTGILSKILATLSVKEASAYVKAGKLAEEVISAVRTVAMFSAQNEEITRYESALEPAKETGIRRGLATAIGSGLLWLVTYGSYALAFWYGSGLVLDTSNGAPNNHQDYDAAKLNIVFFSMLYASIKLGLLLPFIEAIGIARTAAKSVFQIIDRVPRIDASSSVTPGDRPASFKGNITFEDVKFSYPSRPNVPVLRGVTFKIAAGETVALVGASGCGKSTCIQLLQRFYDPTQGWIQLDGQDLKDLDVPWFRSQIGVVGQEPVLFRQSIRDNISFGLPKGENPSNQEIENAARLANAHEFIQRLPNGYDTIVGERGAQLSGGQKQRIAIARALIRQPKILLLDEATSALDNESESLVQQALDQASRGRTTVIVAHRLSTIRNADRILVFNKGLLEEEGNHDTLMAIKGIYHSLVKSQIKHSFTSSEKFSSDEDKKINRQSESSVRNAKEGHPFPYSGKSESTETQDISPQEKPTTYNDVSLVEILKWNKPEWVFMVCGAIGSVMLGMSMPLYAMIYGEVMGLLGQADEEDIYQKKDFFSLMFLVNAFIAGIGAFLQIFMFSMAGERLTYRIRKNMYEAMLYKPIAWFDSPENSTGALCSQLASDATAIQGATGARFGLLIQVFVSIFLSLVLSLTWNWKLALASAVFVPIVLISAVAGMIIGRGNSQAKVDALEKSSGLAAEAIANIRTVASLGREATFHQKYMEALEESHHKSKKNSIVRGLIYAFTSNASAFASIVCMGYGGYLIEYEALDYKQVFKTCEALIFGMEMIGQAMAFTPNYSRAKMAANRINQLIQQRKASVFDDKHASKIIISDTKGKISFDNVYFRYPGRPEIPILQGLSASIEPGSIVAIVGQSGCGKSTCIQLLQRFYDADRGTVRLDNYDVCSITLESLRFHLGIVSQEPVLFDRTIAENIAYGENSQQLVISKIIEAAKEANIHSFIQALPLGYDTRVGRGGMQLSGGQKQRIAIARMLVRKPKIVLLDEATSALDVESERVVQDALSKAAEGRTCIVVAHRLSTIQNANRILVLHQGRIHEEGTHEELLQMRGIYYALWDIQRLISSNVTKY